MQRRRGLGRNSGKQYKIHPAYALRRAKIPRNNIHGHLKPQRGLLRANTAIHQQSLTQENPRALRTSWRLVSDRENEVFIGMAGSEAPQKQDWTKNNSRVPGRSGRCPRSRQRWHRTAMDEPATTLAPISSSVKCFPREVTALWEFSKPCSQAFP